jgi:hypothetical protein
MNDDTLDTVIKEAKEEDKKIVKKKEFVTADNYDEHLYNEGVRPQGGIEESIKRYWNILGTNVIVECPHCGRRQPTTTCLSKKCVGCHKTFQIYPANKPSRVIYCPKKLLAHLHTVHSLEIDGRYPNI